MHALAILNPHAASGQSVRRFEAVRPLLATLFRSLRVAVTQRAEEVAAQVAQAEAEGCNTVLAVGGDGTNLAVLNALAGRPGAGLTFATLPLGTGRDWSRSLGVPLEPREAVEWLRRAVPCAVDVGRVRRDGVETLFLNVASAGLSGAVGQRVNAARTKRPWTFLNATVRTLLEFDAAPMRVTLDGEVWHEGDAFLLAVGNGRYFGRGMKVCPDARINDGLFDVVLVERMGRLEAIRALPSLFAGTHLRRPDVHLRRARHVRIEALAPPLGTETDGEPALAYTVEFDLLPRAITMLADPTVAALHEA